MDFVDPLKDVHVKSNIEQKQPLKKHPWERTIKDHHSKRILRAHNSVLNPMYPKPKEGRKIYKDRIRFTVIGNAVTKEFIYCVKMVKGMHKYRQQTYDAPIIRGLNGIEWPIILRQLKEKLGGLGQCLEGQVAVFCNKTFLGGEKELKKLIEERYIYYITLDYPRVGIDFFRQLLNNTGRPCAYMLIAIDDEVIGNLMFMLYSDIVPRTCENFLRLCHATKGGYSGTPVHRIVEGGWIQCGGFGLKDVPLGCESFVVPHDRRGVLGMCNADRDIDCSTQFFVLLQPAPWMNGKYVAFGQLIEGHETISKIEKIRTFYESPTKNITIVKAGILNMECDDIRINKGAVAYIDAHIEDLVSLGETLFEWLMDKVDLEIHLKSLESQIAQGVNETSETSIKDIRATERFMRKKEEIRNEIAATRRKSSTPSHVSRPEEAINHDFDVESYQLGEFGGEEYAYEQVEPKEKQTRKHAYYIPLTDVPYPGERDSTFDLKRFLQGDYCLPDDLDPNINASKVYGEREKEKFSKIANAIASYSQSLSEDLNLLDDEEGDDDIDEEEIESIINYLCETVDKVSFSGRVVETIANKYVEKDLSRNENHAFNDEEIRRMRLAIQDLKTKHKISLKVCPWKTHTELKRRPTGFHPYKIVPDSYDDGTKMADEEEASKNRGRNKDLHTRQKGLLRGSISVLDISKSSQWHAGPSVLDRLYSEVDHVLDEEPTLKGYKPLEKVNLEQEQFTLSDKDNLKTYLTRDHKVSSTSLLPTRSSSETYPQSGKHRRGLTIDEYRSMNQLQNKENIPK